VDDVAEPVAALVLVAALYLAMELILVEPPTDVRQHDARRGATAGRGLSKVTPTARPGQLWLPPPGGLTGVVWRLVPAGTEWTEN
jgi:hypothetical protein